MCSQGSSWCGSESFANSIPIPLTYPLEYELTYELAFEIKSVACACFRCSLFSLLEFVTSGQSELLPLILSYLLSWIYFRISAHNKPVQVIWKLSSQSLGHTWDCLDSPSFRGRATFSQGHPFHITRQWPVSHRRNSVTCYGFFPYFDW